MKVKQSYLVQGDTGLVQLLELEDGKFFMWTGLWYTEVEEVNAKALINV